MMVDKKIWEEEVKTWLKPELKEKAEEYYKSVNLRPYPKLQQELASAFTEKGIPVLCDAYVGKMLKVDILFKDKKAAIVIYGKELFNEDKRLRGGEHMKFLEAQDYKLFLIKGEEWKSWEEDKKKEKIKEIIKVVKML